MNRRFSAGDNFAGEDTPFPLSPIFLPGAWLDKFFAFLGFVLVAPENFAALCRRFAKNAPASARMAEPEIPLATPNRFMHLHARALAPIQICGRKTTSRVGFDFLLFT